MPAFAGTQGDENPGESHVSPDADEMNDAAFQHFVGVHQHRSFAFAILLFPPSGHTHLMFARDQFATLPVCYIAKEEVARYLASEGAEDLNMPGGDDGQEVDMAVGTDPYGLYFDPEEEDVYGFFAKEQAQPLAAYTALSLVKFNLRLARQQRLLTVRSRRNWGMIVCTSSLPTSMLLKS